MATKVKCKPFTVPITNRREPEVLKYEGYRTIEQFEAVRLIASRPDFDFSVGPRGMFSPMDGGKKCKPYTGPFNFAYYDKSNRLHGCWIGKRGKILDEAIVQSSLRNYPYRGQGNKNGTAVVTCPNGSNCRYYYTTKTQKDYTLPKSKVGRPE